MTDTLSVGKTAGDIWEYLEGAGKSSVSAVEKAISAPGREVHMAIGWLAREDQVELGEESRGLYIWIKQG
ncbi:MAG: winged helix-turn-helix domain-containing protein [Anaerolineales bacterium]